MKQIPPTICSKLYKAASLQSPVCLLVYVHVRITLLSGPVLLRHPICGHHH